MPRIYTNRAALEFWQANPGTNARSLAATRFVSLAENGDDTEWRQQTVAAMRKGAVHSDFAKHRESFSARFESQGGIVIHAKLEARLILNAATGVVENGGISLDRNSGFPVIPGSAIKAAARRYALQELGMEADLPKKAQLLASLAITYGYGDQEWQAGRKVSKNHLHGAAARSDFWLAMVPLSETGTEHDARRDSQWEAVAASAKKLICEKLGLREAPRQLAGCIAFLSAFPDRDPGIEADIITNHHPKYYKGDQTTALDNENPNPVVFPAIAKGATFQFTIAPLRAEIAADYLPAASQHLAEALQILGLGAKTNAGYGWFSIDNAARQRAETERAEKLEQEARDARRLTLSEEEIIAEDLQELPHEQFTAIITNLEQEDLEKQKIVCQMLLGSQKEQWKKWKRQKKGKWIDRVPKIREIAATHQIELP